ncbi:putative phosphodiesterase [Hyphomicrobiales bacterium]|nr:putative phosphodiesterase [Hyphomicrobiales bacterium]CAH1701665.1 Putative phosphodiesterase [Hyphomicrobiales bacterium]CAI0345831.1 putative phosphodiesterase [Hyphomicrobiales bacterium]
MRLGVIADIHGNLPALEAVLARLDEMSVDRLINLGDCASGPLWPAETVALLRSRAISHVRGNHDRVLGAASPEALGASDNYAWQALDPEARAWLAGLPAEATVEGALCFHASPGCDETYLMEEVHDGHLVPSPVATIEQRLAGRVAALMLCGHSHLPRAVRLGSGAVVLNPGSVGNPAYRDTNPAHVSESGMPHARFAVVTLGAEIAIEHHLVVYDWERAAGRAEANMRADWAHALRTGTAKP